MPAEIPITGRADDALKPFDETMTSFMAARSIPAGALAVARSGRLLLARGYGNWNRRRNRPTTPETRFRIASLSKPFTAVAVLRLIEESRGQVTLDTGVLDLLDLEPHRVAGQELDPRWLDVTLRHCLQHRGGWDRQKSFDPMFRPRKIAAELGSEPPAGAGDVVRYMLGQPLDFDPGERYAYSNFGYCVLGRVIEAVSGKPYANYVKRKVLRPLGISRMQIGHTLPKRRARGEVWYSEPTGARAESVFGPPGKQVRLPDGGFYLEAMDSHGGWIASAVDLLRFAVAFDDPEHCPVLSADSIYDMFERPPGLAGHDKEGDPKPYYYGLGWLVRPVGKAGRANTWHGGSLPGTHTLLVRRWDGLGWAALFNQRKDKSGRRYGEIDPALHRAAKAVQRWPAGDLFPDYA